MYRPGGGRSRLTWRLLKVLVDYLPAESACKTAARDEMDPADLAALPSPAGHGPWSGVELRLADLYDQLAWVIYAIYHAQGGKPKKPEPFPRPGVETKRNPQKRVVTEEGLAYLERLRRQRGGTVSDGG